MSNFIRIEKFEDIQAGDVIVYRIASKSDGVFDVVDQRATVYVNSRGDLTAALMDVQSSGAWVRYNWTDQLTRFSHAERPLPPLPTALHSTIDSEEYGKLTLLGYSFRDDADWFITHGACFSADEVQKCPFKVLFDAGSVE